MPNPRQLIGSWSNVVARRPGEVPPRPRVPGPDGPALGDTRRGLGQRAGGADSALVYTPQGLAWGWSWFGFPWGEVRNHAPVVEFDVVFCFIVELKLWAKLLMALLAACNWLSVFSMAANAACNCAVFAWI